MKAINRRKCLLLVPVFKKSMPVFRVWSQQFQHNEKYFFYLTKYINVQKQCCVMYTMGFLAKKESRGYWLKCSFYKSVIFLSLNSLYLLFFSSSHYSCIWFRKHQKLKLSMLSKTSGKVRSMFSLWKKWKD